jgi:hypothetical protein
LGVRELVSSITGIRISCNLFYLYHLKVSLSIKSHDYSEPGMRYMLEMRILSYWAFLTLDREEYLVTLLGSLG